MKTKQFLIGLGFLFFIGSCAEKKAEQTSADLTWDANSQSSPGSTAARAEPAADKDEANGNANPPVSSSAAVETNKNDGRKFVRTADLLFKVKNVIKATYSIEDIVSRHGGFVTHTSLNSNINSVNTTAISADSSLETTYFTVVNYMTIRVPNTKLDTTLKDIAKHIEYLDHRLIKAEDVSLQILSNDLTQKRSAKTEKRLADAIDNRGKKLDETVQSEEILSNKQEQADNAKIANLTLNDQISFSTITLNMYQRQEIKRELISNHKNIDAYEVGFGHKLIDALSSGWHILEVVILFILNLWGLILAAVAVFFLYRFAATKLKK
ncbi:DUF4349 domain-containing protein [Cytophaga aurantiaca]|uniref:DUF4349 domain-containing protein n=1 Tax=Cytophaga aurantiaca TaxID=29530 RepID=UPI00036ECB0A|nr:DUF4349 domain-containing protein [Cytophaga aurantiaca]